MSKFFLVLIVFTGSLSIMGQGLPRKWYGLNVGPQLSYRHLYPADHSEFTEWFIKNNNEATTPFLSGRLGAFVGYRVSRNFGFEMGLQYSYHNYRFQLETQLPGEIDPNYGLVMSDEKVVFTSYDHFHQLMVPLKWVISTSKRKINLTVSIGLVPSVFIDSHTHSITKRAGKEADKSSNSADIFENRFQLDAQATLGMMYRLSQFNFIKIEPFFQFGMIPIESRNSNRSINTRLWSTGIQVSYLHRLQ